MAFIDCVEWKPQSNDVYAWRFPEDNLSTAAQVIVRESQEAVFFSKGQILDKLGPGKHSLKTENLPLLRGLYGLPFGKKNPFTAEIWFVNKAAPLNIDWKTTPARIHDPDYGQMIPVVATGRYGVKVAEAEKFLVKLVGTINTFDTNSLTDHFKGILISKTNSLVTTFMRTNNVGITQISGYLEQIGQFLNDSLKEFWADYGLEMTGFYVTSIDLDTSTPDGKKIAEALSDRTAQNIAGYTWQQKQGFGTVNNAVNQSKGGLGMMGAAMMMGGGIMGGGNGIGSQMMSPTGQAPMAQNPNANSGGMGLGQGQIKEVFCSNCNRKFPVTSRFCPFCGDVYNPCPVCGSDNSTDAKRCSRCGASLAGSNAIAGMMQQNNCPRCGASFQPGTRFCQNCGNKLV